MRLKNSGGRKKRLTHIGNSLVLVIEKPILDLLNITQEAELEISTDGKRLMIEPLRPNRKRRLADTAKRALDTPEETFRRLAK